MRNKDYIGVVYCYDDIVKNQKENKLSALLTLEEGAVVNGDLSYLRNPFNLRSFNS